MSLMQNGRNENHKVLESQQIKIELNGETIFDETIPENFTGTFQFNLNTTRTQ